MPVHAEVGAEPDDEHSDPLLGHAEINCVEHSGYHVVGEIIVCPRGVESLELLEVLLPRIHGPPCYRRVSQLELDIRQVGPECRTCKASNVLEDEHLRLCLSNPPDEFGDHVAIVDPPSMLPAHAERLARRSTGYEVRIPERGELKRASVLFEYPPTSDAPKGLATGIFAKGLACIMIALDQREVPEPSEVCPDCKPAGACEQLQRTREEGGWLGHVHLNRGARREVDAQRTRALRLLVTLTRDP